MKIQIEIDDALEESLCVIHCPSITPDVLKIQEAIADVLQDGSTSATRQFVCYKGDTEYYIPIDSILFFETSPSCMQVHTSKEMYTSPYRLYELEDLLPRNFMRISKSTILNTNHVYSITKNLTASSAVAFRGCHKEVYVSRHYYKPLKIKLSEKRGKNYE